MTPAKREGAEREVRVILCGGCVEIYSICQRQVRLLVLVYTERGVRGIYEHGFKGGTRRK